LFSAGLSLIEDVQKSTCGILSTIDFLHINITDRIVQKLMAFFWAVTFYGSNQQGKDQQNERGEKVAGMMIAFS